MPSLICDLRPEAAALAAEYEALAAIAEPLALYWPAAPVPRNAGYRAVASLPEFRRAWEDEVIAVADRVDWLPLDEFTRVVILEAAGADVLAHALQTRGCDQIERVKASALNDLAQSWTSGRRFTDGE